MPRSDVDDLTVLVDRLSEGWSQVTYRGRPYGVTKLTHGSGRSLSIYAEQLGGTDVVSANVYRTQDADVLKPCEVPAAKVIDFLREHLSPAPADVRSRPPRRPAPGRRRP